MMNVKVDEHDGQDINLCTVVLGDYNPWKKDGYQ